MKRDQNQIETEKCGFPETPPHQHQALDRKSQTSSWNRGIMSLLIAMMPFLFAGIISLLAYFGNLVLNHESRLASMDAKLDYIVSEMKRGP